LNNFYYFYLLNYMSYFKRVKKDNNKIIIGNVDYNNLDNKQFFNDVGIEEEISKKMMNNFEENNYSLGVILSCLLFNDNFLIEIKNSKLNKSFLYELKMKYFYKYNKVIDEDIKKLNLEIIILDLIREIKEKYIPPSSKPSGDECKKDILKINNLLSICKFLNVTDKYNNAVNLIPELDSMKKMIFQKENENIRLNSTNGNSMIY